MSQVLDGFLPPLLPPLPSCARTRTGVEYNPLDRWWKFRSEQYHLSANFDALLEIAEPLIYGLKQTLIWTLENQSMGTAQTCFTNTLRLLREIAKGRPEPIHSLTHVDILNFKSSSAANESVLGSLANFLRKWHSFCPQDIGADAISLFDQLSLRQLPKGVAVNTLDPKFGPFTDLEFESIQHALNKGFSEGSIDEDNFLLMWLFIALGARPAQLAALKIGDLKAPSNPMDGSDYWLTMPLAKQKNMITRDEFIYYPLVLQVAEPLHLWTLSLFQRFSGLLKDPWQAPMFPRKKIDISKDPKGFEYHCTNQDIRRRVTSLFECLGVHSERLNDVMNVTARRFRYTFGTRAAEEGHSAPVIARMMGHKTLGSAELYVALTNRIMERIDKATAFAMAPLAQAFMGRIIRTEDDATRPERSSRIIDLRIDQSGAGLGSCGQHAHCAFCKPIACYGCSDFEPWLDGPHESALDYMLAKRADLIRTTDKRIASVNDRAILGCAQVILRCRELKEHPYA